MTLNIEPTRQAEARAAWAKGQLVVGAYYQHRDSGWLRRVTHLNGRDVFWTDARGPGRSPRSVQERSIRTGLTRCSLAYHGRIALAIAVASGHLDQALDLMLGEVLAIAATGVPGCAATTLAPWESGGRKQARASRCSVALA